MENLVSIITPMYNSSRFIEETILSVLSQTYQNWELLITDDASKDNSIQVVEKYVAQDKRIRLFVSKENIGAAAARNISLSNAKGKFIAFLDSDDLWTPYKLEKQLTFMLNNGYAFSITNYSIIEEDGSKTNKTIVAPVELNYHQYLRNTIIGCLTVMINKELTGDFEMPNIKSSHDMALWLQIMKRGYKVYGLADSLSLYRLVSNSNTAKKWKAAKDVWRVYRNFENLSLIYSAFNFAFYAFNAVKKRI
jgi:teichuronic acid biosynthesis glycosyltransferase TuaG